MSLSERNNTVWAMLLAGVMVILSMPVQGAVDHTLLTKVLKDHVENGSVDYPAIRKDTRFREYLTMLGKVDPYSIAEEKERLAFWINAYNAFTIKLINDHYPVESIRDIRQGETGPWDIVWIDLAGNKYSLNQIEHEIIRKEFQEARIHFALVCAARGCPPLRPEAYTAGRLDEQLDDNARIFLLDQTRNRYDSESRTLYLSEIFDWFGEDFAPQYGSAEEYVLHVLGRPDVRPARVQYLAYDWSLNSK